MQQPQPHGNDSHRDDTRQRLLAPGKTILLPPAQQDQTGKNKNQQAIQNMVRQIGHLEGEWRELLARKIIIQGQRDVRQPPLRITGLCGVGGADQLLGIRGTDMQRLTALDAIEDEHPMQSRSIGEYAHCDEHRDCESDNYRA